MLKQNGVQFNKYRRPPALDRGICEQCKKPVAGFFRGIPGLGLAFINADNIQDKSLLTPTAWPYFLSPKKRIYWR